MPLVDLDRFDFLYATRVKGMKSAATRDLMATLSRPGIISLAGGFPDTRAFGEEAFREISRNIAQDAAQALQYGPTAGLEAIKDVIVEVMGAEGTPARQEDVFVTTGAQQGLDLIAKVFLDEGDAVLCEGPTYAGALNAFAAYRPRIAHAPMDRAGIIPVAARETLKKARKQGLHVKFLYTVPNFQNPAGVTMVAERRRELLEMAREFDLVIVEDNPYGMLRFEGEPLPSLAALEQEEGDLDRVVYLGTFSKIFAPGVRLGWVHAQPGILHKINVGKQGADLCSSNLSQMMISSYFQNADWRAYVKRLTYHVQGTPRRDARLSGRVHAQRGPLDPPRRRALRVGHAPLVPGRDRDATPRHSQERRVRAWRGVLRGRAGDGQEQHAAQLLVRGAGEDPARHRVALRGDPGAHGAAERPGTRLAQEASGSRTRPSGTDG